MALTPMMQQYLEIKEQYKDCILFFRLGDFYEMFFDDAITASRELEITLTGRDCGLSERAHMCGVPFHSAENYISRLITRGYKVAICEQVEDAQFAKGLVKRDVVRVITPGTVVDSSMLDEKKNNYLMSVYKDKYIGIAVVDISTGELHSTSILLGNIKNKLYDEIFRFAPSELLVNSELYSDLGFMETVGKRFNIYVSELFDSEFDIELSKERINAQFSENFEVFESTEDYATKALGALLGYVFRTSKINPNHMKEINKYVVESFMSLDLSSRRNLEISETIRDKSKKGTILWVIDRTSTSMGGRVLRKLIEQPLINVSDINERLDGVEEFKNKFMVRSELKEYFKRVYDMERLIGKVVMGNVNGRDLIALKNSIMQIPQIKSLICECTSELNCKMHNELDSLEDIFALIESGIEDEPPVAIKEGGVIKSGYNSEVDKYREATTQGRNWVVNLENKEREKTGIRNLKVGYNKVFGYYIEITKSYFSQVPDYFIRKQTLANCERYITEELKEIEETILGAQEKVEVLEYEIFQNIRQQIAISATRIKSTAYAIAYLDVLTSLAEVADRENYVRPIVDNGEEIDIKDGRHPVVEKMIGTENFIPNDTFLNLNDNRVAIITGPNMAGKSTYMRQVAIIVLMAQIGSFVPASEARIGVVDKIFTRVGASDDLAAGQSTFMVEMSEVANILSGATARSLIILDEIGRGTSTFDGLSIAWSVIEHICKKDKIGARTLFATHYHELTELQEKIEGIINYCIAVREKGDDIVFLRKIIPGGADGSYGIQVAKLAGLPNTVIERAKEILKELETADIAKVQEKIKKYKRQLDGQIDLFSLNMPKRASDRIVEYIETLDLAQLTPLDALNKLYEFQQNLKNG